VRELRCTLWRQARPRTDARLRSVSGGLEVAGAVGLEVGLFLPVPGIAAAEGLTLLMVGAIAAHGRVNMTPSCRTGGNVISADCRGHCRRTHVELTLPHLPQFHVVIPMKQVEPTGSIAFGSRERVRRGLPRPARNETNLATRNCILHANGNGLVRRLPYRYSQRRLESRCQGSESRCPVYTRLDPPWNQSNSHC
jgi:hypothetical protein